MPGRGHGGLRCSRLAPPHARTSSPGRCQLGWGSAGSGRAGAGWAGCRWYGSGCGSRSGDLVPDGESSGHFGAIVVSGEAMAAGPEMRRDHAEHRQEPLGCAGGAEAFHGAFAVAGSAGASSPPGCSGTSTAGARPTASPPMRHPNNSWKLVGDQHPRYPRHCEQVGWPEGVAPSGSHRSVREPLDSYGSCHLDHQTAGTAVVQTQWAKNRGYWVVTRCHACWNSRRPWNRRYFLRTQRIR